MIESVEVVIKQSGHADRVVRLSEGATRMGRAEDNEIVLSDVGVSRRHAQVYVSRAEVTVEDLGSGNGTFYNGYRIQSQPIQDGDEIVIDPFVLHFRLRGQDRPRSDEAPRGNTASAAPTAARLQMVVGTGVAGQSYPITNRGLSIGRSEDRDVVIADPAASRHHCQIAAQGGEHVLRDMGSANGVFVNAVRVRECVLADGDLIRIGNTEMRFTRSGGAAAEPAPASRVPARAPNEPRAKPGPTVSPRDLPPSDQTMSRNQVPGRAPPRRSGGAGRIGAILGVVFGGSIVLVGGLAVALVAIGVVVYLVAQGSSGIQTYPPQPIRWELELEPGLDPAPVTTLFEEGRNKMRDRDHRGALQDFYRVLLADPGYRYVDKFAFAAGEYLVLDVLQKEFADGAAKRASDEAERDRLLTELRKGNRQAQLRAERQLKRNYAEDPVVVEALDLPESPMSVKLQKTSAEAMEQLKQNQFDEASRQFQSILESAKDPETRNQALASLKLCQKEVARASAEKWTQAVMAEASGDKDAAKRLFQEIKEEHPTNPSPAVHLDRLP